MAPLYHLGPVKSWVEKAANLVGPKFGIKTIGGIGDGGSLGNKSDHPKGLALDFMINNISNGKATGDALNKYVIANANALNVTYTIWYHKYYGRENGFKEQPYTGTSNPHTDHIHVSFKASGISDIKPGDYLAQGTGVGGDPLSKLQWITTPGAWLRLAVGFSGAALLMWGVLKLGGKDVVGKLT